MEKEALYRLESLIAASQKDAGAAVYNSPEGIKPTIVIPESCKVIDLEYLLPEPMAMRGTLQTQRISSFCDYISFCDYNGANQVDGTTIFINDEDMAAVCVLDHGTSAKPGWGRHSVALELEPTAPYAALLKAAAKDRFSQNEFLDFMRDWREYMRFEDAIDGGNEMPFARAVQAIQRIEISKAAKQTAEESNFRTARTAFEEIEVAGDVKPPAIMEFTCAPYPEGFDVRGFRCRISVYTDGSSKPTLGFRVYEHESARDAMRKEFGRIISDNLGSPANAKTIPIYFGRFVRDK